MPAPVPTGTAHGTRSGHYPGGMCAGCAMTAASAATGFRTWLHSHNFAWLSPRMLRGLTIGAMCAAGLVSTIGFSGSTPPTTHTGQSGAAIHHISPSSHQTR